VLQSVDALVDCFIYVDPAKSRKRYAKADACEQKRAASDATLSFYSSSRLSFV